MNIIIYLTLNDKTEFLEVLKVTDDLEASMYLGTLAIKTIKDRHINEICNVFELPDAEKIGEILKKGEIALIWNETKTVLSVYILETQIISGYFSSTPQDIPKMIGRIEYSKINDLSVYPELKTRLQELESQSLTDKMKVQDLQTKLDETLANNELLKVEIYEVLEDNLDIKSECTEKLKEIRDELSTTSESLQIRSNDCKRLVIENARLRDVDDKNYMTIMMLNQEIEKLRSQKNGDTLKSAEITHRPTKKDISPRDVDKKPVRRVTQETLNESSYDDCIRIIKGFDRSKLKSSHKRG